MAKRSKQPIRRPRKRLSRRRRSRRATAPGIGSTLALVSKVVGMYFPSTAAFVSKLTNFALKSIGVSQSVAVAPNGKLVMANPVFSAAQARFGISPQTILGTMPGAFPVKVKYDASGASEKDKFDVENARHFFCPYREARFKHVTITVEPTNTVSTSQGMIYVALVPFVNSDAVTSFGDKADLSVEEFQHFPVRSVGRYGKPVVLRYTPTAHDGDAYQYSPLHELKFGILIYYLDQNRSAANEFSHNDVAFCVKVNGSLDLRTSRISPLTFNLTKSSKTLALTYTNSFEDMWLFRDEIKDYNVGSSVKDLTSGRVYEIEPGSLKRDAVNGIACYSADLRLESMD